MPCPGVSLIRPIFIQQQSDSCDLCLYLGYGSLQIEYALPQSADNFLRCIAGEIWIFEFLLAHNQLFGCFHTWEDSIFILVGSKIGNQERNYVS